MTNSSALRQLYLEQGHEFLAAYLRNISKSDPPDEDLIWSVIGGIEDAALEFLALHDFYSGNYSPATRLKKLRRVEKTAADFLDAMADADASFWHNVLMATDNLPMKKKLKIYDEDTAAVFPMVRRVQAVAAKLLEPGQRGKSKGGPKQNKAVARFAYRLTSHYEAVTGKKPNAYASPNRRGPLGSRAGPFVRFVAASLLYTCPDAITSTLGDVIYNQIFRQAKKAAHKKRTK